MEMAARTPAQKTAQEAYERKVKEIKIRVPNAYFEMLEQKMAEHNKREKDKQKHFNSVNKYVLSLVEKALDEPMVSIREQKRLDNES